MAIAREKKEQRVNQLTEIFRNYPYFYFVDLAAVKTRELTELRKKLAGLGAGYLMVKKSLLRLSLSRVGLEFPEFEQYLGSVGVIYTRNNELEVARLVSEFIKENNPKTKLKNALSFLAGFFEKIFLNREQANQLAKIPSREFLYGQTVNLLISPVAGLAQSLSQVLVKFLMTLKEIEKVKN